MYGLFSRGTSQSNTIVTEGFTDFKNNINKLESPELTIKSPKLGEGQGQEILQRFVSQKVALFVLSKYFRISK